MTIHSSASDLPLMGFGTFIALGEDAIDSRDERQIITEETIFEALKAGYRHFDCAAGYQNEEWVGNAFRKAFLPVSDGGLGLSREDLFITTKGTSSNLETSLESLGIEYSDLHLSHFPSHFSTKATLVEEWSAMNQLVDVGLAKRIGVSNHYKPHIDRLLAVCDENDLRIPYANEIELHPKLQEEDFVNYCQNAGIRLIAYSPLGYKNSAATLGDEIIIGIAKEKLASPAQVTLAWNMKRGVAVIPKSSKPKRMRGNLAAQQLIEHLDANDMKKIKTVDWNVHFIRTSENYKEAGNKISWK